MSLHGKIVAWFVFFAAVAVLVFGLGDYVLATDAARFALEARVGSLDATMAAAAERQYGQLRADLTVIAAAASLRHIDPENTPTLSQFSRVQVQAGGKTVLDFTREDAAETTSGCGSGPVDLRFAILDPAGQPAEVVASVPVHEFFSRVPTADYRVGDRGLTGVFRVSDGGLVHDADCGLTNAAGGLAQAMAREAIRAANSSTNPSHLFSIDPSDGPRLIGATTIIAPPGWAAVVAVDPNEFAEPFLAARLGYLTPIGMCILVALYIVLRGIRHDLLRLSRIARAADEIGRGRFDVWLPPPTTDEVGRLSLSLGRMVDRLSASIRQLEITRSMAAVGELSTYLSHEIRNPLSAIGLNLQMLRRELASGEVPEDGTQLIELSLGELRRLDGVVKAVLELARSDHDPTHGAAPVNETVRETVQIMKRRLEEAGVEVQLELAPEELVAPMNGAALKGLLVNLVVNSIDALAAAPVRRIRIQTGRSDEPGLQATLLLSVRDTGPGVPPHVRQRIFEPFYTSKATGNGIGLSTALRAAQECGGTLRYSPVAEGTGAEFVLELPLSSQRQAGGPGADNGHVPGQLTKTPEAAEP